MPPVDTIRLRDEPALKLEREAGYIVCAAGPDGRAAELMVADDDEPTALLNARAIVAATGRRCLVYRLAARLDPVYSHDSPAEGDA